MVQTHTASLAGASAVQSAFLKRTGVPEVASLTELIETAKLLHVLGPLGDGGFVSLSCSGGEASLVADLAERAGIRLACFPPARIEAIRATVNPLVTVSNPFDYHTFDWGAGERLERTFTEVMRSGQAATALVLDWPKAELGPAPAWDIALDAFCAAARSSAGKAIVVASLPECLPEDRAERLAAEGVAPMQGLAEMMAALRAATELGAAAALPPFTPSAALLATDAARFLDEAEGKARLAAFGLSVPEGEVCATRETALAAAQRLAPVAMKAVGASIAHKTELGAVRLGIATREAADEAYGALARISPLVLVERMAGEAVAELIVGVARDPALGLHLVVGAGGVLAELIEDRAILMLPASEAEIGAALGSLKIDRLLAGYRGRPAADRQAVVSAIAQIAAFAHGAAGTIEELEINPLIAARDGAIAVDVLMKVREPT